MFVEVVVVLGVVELLRVFVVLVVVELPKVDLVVLEVVDC